MYSVGLSNESCLFDLCDGFETVDEALDWASGRGGTYVIQIRNDRRDDAGISISATDGEDGMEYRYYDGWQFGTVTRADIAKMLG